MCIEAKEIQEKEVFQEGDFYAGFYKVCEHLEYDLGMEIHVSDGDGRKLGDGVSMKQNFEKGGCGCPYYCETIFLPRQDQLQELFGTYHKSFGLFELFLKRDYVTNEYPRMTLVMEKPYYPQNLFSSFEKLWLAFVMHEKYNKIWNFEKKTWEKRE